MHSSVSPAVLYVARMAFAWGAVGFIAFLIYSKLFLHGRQVAVFIIPIVVLVAILQAISHVSRVRLIADRVDASTLASRHRRQVEMPFRPAKTRSCCAGAYPQADSRAAECARP